jgi:hypothetical protein
MSVTTGSSFYLGNPPLSEYSTALTGSERPERPGWHPPSQATERPNVAEWVEFLERDRPLPRYTRKYASLDRDPFCTDQSFFRSGRYRLTGYAPRDRTLAPSFVPRREPRRGPYTGAARPDGPKVNRKFGDNTRERVMPFRRYNHMSVSGYDDDIVGSERLPSFLSPTAAIGQGGSEAVLSAAGLTRTLGAGRPGSQLFLLDGSH